MKRENISTPVTPGSQGFVFATTGELYTTLARRAARTLREVVPECNVDLFTDQAIEDAVFDQIHRLDHGFFRPKMQAIRESRFERTIIMDADVVVVADISEVFRILDHCDIAGVEAVSRTTESSGVARCMPPINTGFLAVRSSPAIHRFAKSWEEVVRSGERTLDQSDFRRLLFSCELRFLPLGAEYNLCALNLLDIWGKKRGAPRVLHVKALHKRPPGDPKSSISLDEAIGNRRARHVRNLIATDRSLGGDPDLTALPPHARLRKKLRSLKNRGQLESISAYHSAVLGLASIGNPLKFCIVGANDGKFGDPVFSLIKNSLAEQSDVLLFEPHPSLIPFLSENYAFHPSHHIVNAAIGPKNNLQLHAISEEKWDLFSSIGGKNWPTYRAPTGVTSSVRQHVVNWANRYGQGERDQDAFVTELNVPCSPLIDALESLGRPIEIDVLQVDTEGYDDEVIYACDLEQTRPKIIYFESVHLPKGRRERLRQHLKMTYTMLTVGMDTLAIRKT